MRARLPEEHPTEPPTGWKVARPALSHDGARAGFVGVSLGAALPYGVLDAAHCAYGRRHRSPSRWCDCGFHCLHERAEAAGLLCATEYRGSVLLEVSVLGSFIRFERGFRYARQRVRAATVGPCRCRRRATALADAGRGRPGWAALEPVCPLCLGGRVPVGLAEFARLAGQGLRVAAEPVAEGDWAEPGGVPELVAEAALLQARLDWFQSRLGRLRGGHGQGA
ncbi:hypothetical protein ABT160_40185 [Streptomyces sp. NPDC001941]|uniref:hypothetical protein n=1 Tax=Streptomyces sp. NPDC001941 TaxID=3154659 RepID=UPI00332BA841